MFRHSVRPSSLPSLILRFTPSRTAKSAHSPTSFRSPKPGNPHTDPAPPSHVLRRRCSHRPFSARRRPLLRKPPPAVPRPRERRPRPPRSASRRRRSAFTEFRDSAPSPGTPDAPLRTRPGSSKPAAQNLHGVPRLGAVPRGSRCAAADEAGGLDFDDDDGRGGAGATWTMLVPALSSCLLPFSSAPSHRACRVRIGGTRRQCVQGADPQVGWNGISEEISSRSKSRNLSAKSKAQTKADFSSVQLNNDTSIKRGTKMILQIAAVAKMVASY